MYLVCIDLESVLIPEIWIEAGKKFNLPSLFKTTRDEPDYDLLMKSRIKILHENNIKMSDILKLIEDMKAFDGAVDFINAIRSTMPIIIVSDTFMEFMPPILKKLEMPTLFCHSLSIDDNDFIVDYQMRPNGSKKETVTGLSKIGFDVIAVGDSFNDIPMLQAASIGVLFKSAELLRQSHSDMPSFDSYADLLAFIKSKIESPAQP